MTPLRRKMREDMQIRNYASSTQKGYLWRVGRFARHSSLLVTSVYLHPTDEDLARSVQKIPC